MPNKDSAAHAMSALKREAEEWANRLPRTQEQKNIWIDGATAALAAVDRSYLLSNTALEMLNELFGS